mmetsp:Transcript_70038/g.198518  ORF Transcript_70038/g.198518 Transcript_70038/m.198518 type:complete len:202 (+) Transcript_70038:307-912(+)
MAVDRSPISVRNPRSKELTRLTTAESTQLCNPSLASPTASSMQPRTASPISAIFLSSALPCCWVWSCVACSLSSRRRTALRRRSASNANWSRRSLLKVLCDVSKREPRSLLTLFSSAASFSRCSRSSSMWSRKSLLSSATCSRTSLDSPLWDSSARAQWSSWSLRSSASCPATRSTSNATWSRRSLLSRFCATSLRRRSSL